MKQSHTTEILSLIRIRKTLLFITKLREGEPSYLNPYYHFPLI